VLEIYLWFNWTVENIFEGLSYGGVDYCIMIKELLGFTILIPVGIFKHNELIHHKKLLSATRGKKSNSSKLCS